MCVSRAKACSNNVTRTTSGFQMSPCPHKHMLFRGEACFNTPALCLGILFEADPGKLMKGPKIPNGEQTLVEGAKKPGSPRRHAEIPLIPMVIISEWV